MCKKHFLLIVLQVLLSYISACPDICSCAGSYLTVKVDCSNRMISNIPKAQLESNTEMLILSNNKINSLQSDAFSDLTELEEMYLSGNELRIIPKDVFSNLKSLLLIDLSHNKIEHIDSDTFLKNIMLLMVYLKGNMLLSVSASFVRSPSVIKLDLSFCDIHNLSSNAFDDMTNLRYLFLNNNKLKTVGEETLNKLWTLRSVDLSGNPWSCDDCALLEKLYALNEETHMSVKLPKCNEPPSLAGAFLLDAKEIMCSEISHTEESSHVNISCRTVQTLAHQGNNVSSSITLIVECVFIGFVMLVCSVLLFIFIHRTSCRKNHQELKKRNAETKLLQVRILNINTKFLS